MYSDSLPETATYFLGTGSFGSVEVLRSRNRDRFLCRVIVIARRIGMINDATAIGADRSIRRFPVRASWERSMALERSRA